MQSPQPEEYASPTSNRSRACRAFRERRADARASSSGRLTMLMGRVSTAEYEAIRRAQEGKNYDVKPNLGPRPSRDSVDWEQIRIALRRALKS